MKQEFKAGDKVYCPKSGFKIYTVCQEEGMDVFYQLHIKGVAYRHKFNRGGCSSVLNITPDIFHATPENHELLCKLYGMEFEAPPKRKRLRDVMQAMFDDGWDFVPCFVSNDDKMTAIKSGDRVLIDMVSIKYWEFCIPFDPKTGKTIIDYIDGEIVTEQS